MYNNNLESCEDTILFKQLSTGLNSSLYQESDPNSNYQDNGSTPIPLSSQVHNDYIVVEQFLDERSTILNPPAPPMAIDLFLYASQTHLITKWKQELNIFLFSRSTPFNLYEDHQPFKIKVELINWIKSKHTDKKEIPNFTTLIGTLEGGKAILPVIMKKSGTYFLRCSVITENSGFMGLNLEFKLIFTTAKKNNNNNKKNQKFLIDGQDSQSYIANLQEHGQFDKAENACKDYLDKITDLPTKSNFLIERSIGFIYTGNKSFAIFLLDMALEIDFSISRLFRVSYLKSAIYRMSKNFDVSKVHMDLCDHLYSRVSPQPMETGQYFFNKGALKLDENQKKKENNPEQYNRIIIQLEKAKTYFDQDKSNIRSKNELIRVLIRLVKCHIKTDQTPELILSKINEITSRIHGLLSDDCTYLRTITQFYLLKIELILFWLPTYNQLEQRAIYNLKHCLYFIRFCENISRELCFSNESTYTLELNNNFWNFIKQDGWYSSIVNAIVAKYTHSKIVLCFNNKRKNVTNTLESDNILDSNTLATKKASGITQTTASTMASTLGPTTNLPSIITATITATIEYQTEISFNFF